MQRQARIIIIEDDRVTREVLSHAISMERGFKLVASCPTFETGKKALEENEIDVLVTDLKLPDGDGLNLIRSTHKNQPNTEIMVISILGDETTVVTAITAGASGFLLKDTQQIDIVVAIRDLLEGHSPISTAVARYIIKLAQNIPEIKTEADLCAPSLTTSKPHEGLTERELDILWGIAKGFTYKDVAKRLGLSPNTIPTYIKSIYRKLQVNSRSEAVFESIQRGIINFN